MQTNPKKNPLKQRMIQEIELGKKDAQDPENATLDELYIRKTSIYSPWFQMQCPECEFQFRENDRVRLCPSCGQAYHDDSQFHLHCWHQHFKENNVCKKSGGRSRVMMKKKKRKKSKPQSSQKHMQGCGYQWNGILPDSELENSRHLEEKQPMAVMVNQFMQGLETMWSPFGDHQVIIVKSGDHMIGNQCPICRYKIRVGDRVIKCPCGKCETYFHDDLFRHLTCWNDWNGSEGNNFCPTTGEEIKQEADH